MVIDMKKILAIFGIVLALGLVTVGGLFIYDLTHFEITYDGKPIDSKEVAEGIDNFISNLRQFE